MMTNPQGTVWESNLRNAAVQVGRTADRYPKRGQKGEPDVYIEALPDYESLKPLALVAWKRLVGRKADGRRKPDGVKEVIVMDAVDFFAHILPHVPNRIEIQAKWTSTLNVTRTLGDLRAWIKEHR